MQSDLLKLYNDSSRPRIDLSWKNKLFIAAVLDLFLLANLTVLSDSQPSFGNCCPTVSEPAPADFSRQWLLPFFHIRLLGSTEADGNCGAPCVESYGLPFPHSLQWVGGHRDGELGNCALTKPLHICEQLVWKTWISATCEAYKSKISDKR